MGLDVVAKQAQAPRKVAQEFVRDSVFRVHRAQDNHGAARSHKATDFGERGASGSATAMRGMGCGFDSRRAPHKSRKPRIAPRLSTPALAETLFALLPGAPPSTAATW